MKLFKLNDMKKGWFVGNFEPSIFKNSQFEVAIKTYKKGDYELSHTHKVAHEITAVTEGTVRMADTILNAGDIILIEPGEFVAFECLSETATNVVVKYPSAQNDKYLLDNNNI